MSWLREAASSPHTGKLSSSRLIALAAGFSISFSIVFLSLASYFRPELVSAVMALGPSLAAMAGGGYVANRMTGSKNETLHDADKL